MEYRQFGTTDLEISEIGFGAWAIGGAAMAGNIPIGWGAVQDNESLQALQTAFDRGVNFYDTADFYGLGHSETLIGQVFGNRPDVIIATKVGHRLAPDQSILIDYSKEYIMTACEASLRRLQRDAIDYYQLHTAKINHLRKEECIEAMHALKAAGKIRYWGLSLNTFHPEAEADYLMSINQGDGFQLVLNLINQLAIPTVIKAANLGYGIIARMPLQFGLLTGKFSRNSRFKEDDHRSFRLTPSILDCTLTALDKIWPLSDKYGISKSALSLSFILGLKEISTVIPGMKTSNQVNMNTSNLIKLTSEDQQSLIDVYKENFKSMMNMLEKAG